MIELSKKYYKSCGTLGKNIDDPTCSMIAAKEWNKFSELIAFDYFESAIQNLKLQKIQSVYVPGAYPDIRSFIFDSSLKISEINLHMIPNIVLVGTAKVLPTKVTNLFYHPATSVFINQLNVEIDRMIPAPSNSQACISLLNSNITSLAITNEACAMNYNLCIYEYLASNVYMPFYLFTLKEV